MIPQPPNPRSVFGRAVELESAADRHAYVAEACAGAPEVRERVEALLRAHEAAGGFLQPAAAGPADTACYAPSPEAPNTVGPYKLLEKIGEGGMGEVWVADQTEPIKRRVALKLIKPGMDSLSVLARFEAERQALAVMDHPNIAKVLDAGTTPDGRPYFVMELVKGTPITEFCDVRQLTPKERLELFVPVCQAIQHAHMKGIIHRDIKPSNVLVELYDDKAVAKVIDFGVAKAIGQRLTEKTIYTGFGALVGTPAYMAPEQATFNALDVDTRADVYALGVLLYELLAGSPPIEKERLNKAALDEVLRIVRDEEPMRPSQRLSTSQTKASIAATRRSDAAALSQMMKGELDWIVMKALEKDRTRRYDTATALAKDVQRYLSGEPVQAVPPSLGYRLRKTYRRNRAAVLVASAFALLVTGSAALSIGLAVDARRSEHLARENETAARAAQTNAVNERDDKDKALAAETRAKEGLQTAVAAERQAAYDLTIPLVQKAMQENDLPRATALLASCPAELRNWEWHFLNRQFDRGSVTLRPGYSAGTSSGTYRFTADGGRVVWLDGTALKTWDAATGRSSPAVDLAGEGPAKLGDTARSSPDGGRIAVWHKPRYRTEAVRGDDGKVETKVFDAPELVPNTTITLVAADTGKPQATLVGSPDPVRALLFSRDGSRVATAGAGNEVRVWDATSGKLLHKLTCDGFKQAVPVAFTPDGSALVINTADQLFVDGITPRGGSEFRVWDLETGKVRVTGPIPEYKDGPASGPGGRMVQIYPMQETPFARVSPNGRFAMGLSTDRFITVTDLTTGKAAFTLPGDFRGVGFRADGAVLAVNPQGVCAAFELPGGTTLASYTLSSVRSFRQGGGLWRTIDLSADGRWLIAYYQESGTVEVREAETGAVVRTVFVERNGFFVRGSHGVVDGAGNRLLTTALNGEMKVWDLTVRTPGDSVKLRTESVWSPTPLVHSPDRRIVAVLGSRPDPANPKSIARPNELELVDLTSGSSRTCRDTLGNFSNGRHTHAAFSRDGRSVAATAVSMDTTPSSSAELRVLCTPMVWDATTAELTRHGEPIRAGLSSILDDAHIPQVGFAPDGSPVVAAVATDDPPAKRVWRVREIAPDGKLGRVRATVPAGARSCLRLSADGRFAARFGRSADAPGVLVWDLAADRSVWAVPAVPGLSGELDGAFSADGTRLVVTDAPAGASMGNGRPDLKRAAVGVFLSESGRAVSTFAVPVMSTRAGFSVSPDGRRVVWFPINTGTSVVMNADTGRELLANFDAGEGLSQSMNPRGLLASDGRLLTGRTPIERSRILIKECSLRVWDGRPAERVWAPAPTTDELLTRAIRLCEDPDPATRDPAAALRIATEACEWYPNEYGCRLALGLALFRTGRPAEAETVLTACVVREEEAERPSRLPPGAPAGTQLRRATAYYLLALVTAANGQPERAKVWFAWGDTRLASPFTQGNRALTALRSSDADTERGRADPFRREAARVLGLSAEPVAAFDFTKSGIDPALAANRMLEVGAMVKRKEYSTALWAAEFLLAHGDPHPSLVYNAACVYSLAAGGQPEKKAEYGTRAVELLREAMKLGYGDAVHTEADTDFESVRAREDFRKVLAEMREKFPPKAAPKKPPGSK